MPCIPNDDRESVINSAGGGDPIGAHTDQVSAHRDTITKVGDNITREGRDNEQATASINSIINDSASVGEDIPLSQHDNSNIRSASNIILDIAAADGELRQMEAWDAATALASNSVLSKSNFVHNLVSSTNAALVNSTSAIRHFLLHFAGQEGPQATNNQMVAHFDAIPANAAGYTAYYIKKYADPLIGIAKEIAKRHGTNEMEVLQDIGNYARAEHTPEANAYQLKRWAAEIEAERAKGDKANPSRIARLEKEIADLENNIDNPDPTDGEGGRLCATGTGYTNAEAENVQADLLSKYNMTADEMESYTQAIRNMYNEIQEQRAREGFLTQSDAELLPDEFQKFVPTRTESQMSNAALNDATIFNPGSLHARDGVRNAPVDDAFTAVMKFLRYASTEHSIDPFAKDLYALYLNHRENGIDSGLKIHNYRSLLAQKRNGVVSADRILNSETGGGIITRVPTVDAKTGETRLEPWLVTFDQGWTDTTLNTGLNGIQLNKAFNFHERSVAALSLPTTLTSFKAQTVTRFNPAFPVVNSIGDSFERLNGMAAQSYTLEDGRTISGWKLLPSYVAHFPTAMSTLFGVMRGTLDRNSPNGRLWDEYVRGGLLQEYTPGRDTNQSELSRALVPPGSTAYKELTTNPHLRALKGALDTASAGTLRKIVKLFDAWNSYFNNIASFNQYLTLRNHHVTMESARDNTLSMMNLRQAGSWTPVMRAFYPFVKPTMQGAAAMMRSVGLAPNAKGEFRPNARGIAMMLANAMAFSLISPLARESLGEDADGNNRYDSIPLGQLARFTPLALDRNTGEYFKLRHGFGFMQPMAVAVIGWDRLQRGLISPEDYGAELSASLARNVSPTDFPSFSMTQDPFKWFASVFTPDIIKPVTSVALNIGANGSTLTYGNAHDATPLALQGRKSTESWYHQKALDILKLTGMNIAPEQLKGFMESMFTGVTRIIPSMLTRDSMRAAGVDKTNAEILGPWAGSFLGLSIMHGTAANLNVRRGYDELNKLTREIQRLGVKTTSSTAYKSNDSAGRENWLRRQLEEAGMDSQRIDQYFILSRAARDVATLSRRLNNNVVSGNWFDEDNLDSLRAYFKDFGERRDVIFSEAIRKAGLR